jgi:predicted nucleic acid-binding protein
MILVDTSVIVAWLDTSHEHHRTCSAALAHWAHQNDFAISSVTFAELAAGGRTREAIEEELQAFIRLDLDFESAWRAGRAFRQHRPSTGNSPVLPDFFIRAQAATLGLRHLTNDRRRLAVWLDVDFVFPERAR